MKLAILVIVFISADSATSQIVPAEKCEYLAAQARQMWAVGNVVCLYYDSKVEKP